MSKKKIIILSCIAVVVAFLFYTGIQMKKAYDAIHMSPEKFGERWYGERTNSSTLELMEQR